MRRAGYRHGFKQVSIRDRALRREASVRDTGEDGGESTLVDDMTSVMPGRSSLATRLSTLRPRRRTGHGLD